jgi:predicted DNA-binding transcriptional regulator AlpA
MSAPSEFMTTIEVGELIRSPWSTVRYWRHRGTGPKSFRLGRRVMYRRTDVDQWIAEREQVQTSSAGKLTA